MIEHAVDLLACQLGALHLLGRQFCERGFLLSGCRRFDAIALHLTQFVNKIAIQRARITAAARGDFRRQQCRNDAVLVSGPHRAVLAQERRAGAFLTTKTEGAAIQPVDKPFEADRHFVKLATEPFSHPINHRRADHGLADRRLPAPLRSVLEQVIDQHRQVMIGLHQTIAAGHDAVAVMVGIAGERDVVLFLQADQSPHGIRRRRIHADLAVPVHGHKAKLRIDLLVDHGKVELVAFGNRRPVMHTGAAQRVHSQMDAGAPDRVEVDDVAEVGDIGVEIIMRVCCRGLARLRQRHALDVLQGAFEQRIGAILNPAGDTGVRRAAVRRVVFETAVVRRVVRRCDHDAVGQA